MAKILFVYPNEEGYPIIPLGISILSAALKSNGHFVELFDTTFMTKKSIDNIAKEASNQVKKVDTDNCWKMENKDIDKEFTACLSKNIPDVIAFSIIENNYGSSKRLFKIARQKVNSKILVGGLFPTVAQGFFIDDNNVDLICVGEGEKTIVELANRLDKKCPIDDIDNLIVKDGSEIIRNKLGSYYNWEPYICADWSLFDDRHIIKPFMGKMRRTGFLEMARGCPFGCSYCINKKCQDVFRGLGKYYRSKPLDLSIKEMKNKKEKYGLDLIFFNDENFFSMNTERFHEFSKLYEKEVGLPFVVMSRANSFVDEKIVARLKDINCVTIAIGIETGNEEKRAGLLNKKIPNEIYEKALKNCRKYKIRTTSNIIVGLPFETESDIMESVEFCKKLEVDSLSVSIFAPYYGTKLRDICVQNGFMEDRYYEDISINSGSILTMPQLSKDRIQHFYYNFVDMVCGKK